MYPALFICEVFRKRVTDGVHKSSLSENFSANRVFFVKDLISNVLFMVDTGSSCSIWPLLLVTDRPWQSALVLHAGNSSQIMTYGQRSLTLDLNLRRSFSWFFVVTDLPYPILGADFLNHFHLLVDVKKQRLVDMSTSLSTPTCLSTDTVYSLSFFLPLLEIPSTVFWQHAQNWWIFFQIC